MKLIHLIIITLFFIHFAYAQISLPLRPYEKLSFESIQPIWYETAFHPEMVSDVRDGYNRIFFSFYHESGFIDGEFVYNVFSTLADKGFWGGYVEKRRLGDGSLVWNTQYSQTNTERQELIKHVYIRDGKLKIIGMRRFELYDRSLPFFGYINENCRMTYREIDLKTGEVLVFKTGSNEDPSLLSMIATHHRGVIEYENIFYTENEEELLYVKRLQKDSSEYVVRMLVDHFGRPLSNPDTVYIGVITFLHQIIQISVDTFMYLELEPAVNSNKIKYFDDRFNLLKVISLDKIPYPNIGISAILEVFNDKVLIGNEYFNFPFSVISTYSYMLYDLNGELLNSFVVPQEFISNFYGKYLPDRDKLVFIGSRNLSDGVKPLISLFECETNDKLSKIYDFNIKDSLRSAIFSRLIESGTNILFTSIAGSFFINNSGLPERDIHAKAVSTMLFDAQSIGLGTVSTKETLTNSKQLKISPNPTVEQVDIQFSEHQSGMLYISDATGRLCMQKEISSVENVSLNVSAFQAGIYFVNFVSTATKGVNAIGKFVKVE